MYYLQTFIKFYEQNSTIILFFSFINVIGQLLMMEGILRFVIKKNSADYKQRKIRPDYKHTNRFTQLQ